MAAKKFSFNIQGIDQDLLRKTALTYVSVIFLVVVSVLFVLPTLSDLESLRRSLGREESKVENLRASLRDLDEFETRLGTSGQELSFTALPVSFDPGLVLADLRRLGESMGVTITTYSLSGGEIKNEKEEMKAATKTEPNDRVLRVAFSLSVAGEPQKLLQFMEALERGLPLLSIVEFKASEISEVITAGQTENIVDLDLSLNYFYFPFEPTGEMTTLETYRIDNRDLSVLGQLQGYRQPEISTENVRVVGGNQNLFDL